MCLQINADGTYHRIRKVITDRHIEVKGRVKDASTLTVTRNEILYALNQEDKFLLAIVLVNEDDSFEGPHYLRKPFTKEPEWGVASVNYDLNDLLSRAEAFLKGKIMIKSPKKLIEVALPLDDINIAASYEKMPGIGPHPRGVHHLVGSKAIWCSKSNIICPDSE